nr:S1/P1 nuclease [uncultured Flavobacterium sp.]
MKRIFTALSFFIILFSSINALAWGHKGHSLVAEVAFKYLDAKTKQNVLSYLNGMSIEDAANWMDSMKSERKFDFMKPYHYVNFENGEAVTEPSGDNIIRKINTTLKDLDNIKSLSNDEIKTRLFYLFHLIGDLHQPLHVGYKDDKGGNSVQVSFFGKGSNLHSMWDTEIIERKGLSFEECLNSNKYSNKQFLEIQKINVVDWTKETKSYLDKVYEMGNNKINDKYVDANYPIIKEQILKAGIRLASVLDHYFKNVTYVSSIKKDVVQDNVEKSVGIDVTKASEYEGKLVSICAKVFSTKVLDSNGMTFLNVGGAYPNSPLTVVIYSDKLQNFSFKPSEYYKLKNICITGRIKIYKGKPEIISNSEHDIIIK